MALKGDRHEFQVDIKYFLNDVAEKGTVLVYGPGGGSGTGPVGASGIGLDSALSLASVAGNPSGLLPVGLLLNNQVSIDQTRQHINFMRDEMIVGGKCSILKQGWVITNKVTGTPSAGNTAYLTTNGNLTPTVSSTGGTAATPKVGQFETSLDQDGYCRVQVHLP